MISWLSYANLLKVLYSFENTVITIDNYFLDILTGKQHIHVMVGFEDVIFIDYAPRTIELYEEIIYYLRKSKIKIGYVRGAASIKIPVDSNLHLRIP